MLQRVKTVLVEEYIGAIVIALLLWYGIASFLGVVTTPLFRVLMPDHDPSYSSSVEQLVTGFVSGVLYIFTAAGLGYWLYRQPRSRREPRKDL